MMYYNQEYKGVSYKEIVMDIKQLKTLLILCETLNYQREASILQYEPSTLHKHIQKLEEEIGVQLFIKQGKKLAATERCMEVERYARNILNEYHTMISGEPAESNGMEPITVTGCETNLTKTFEGMLKDYLHLHPGLDMSVPVVRNKDVPDMVRSGMADVGFYYMDSLARLPGLQKVTLYQEPFDIALPKGHPLCKEKVLTYEMLSRYPFSFMHEDCAPVKELLLRFKKRSITPAAMRNMGNIPAAALPV